MLRTIFLISLLFGLLIGQTKPEKELSDLEKKGDLAFSNNDYEEALEYYNDACRNRKTYSG